MLNPNGASKTTTIWMILHILHPDCGEIEVLGERSTRAANGRIGILSQGQAPSIAKLLGWILSK